MGMNMLEIPVKLIVKAPNQQVEDQTIHCSLSWTIKKLKGYLSEVYPSKPNTEDQRLIYYGQLLNDSVTLKDVFTRYEAEEETHTIHLVCMPSKENLKMQARKMIEESSKKVKENTSNGVSTSQRLPLNENEGITSDNRDSAPMIDRNYMYTNGFQNWMNETNSQSLSNNNYIQQWAWMQQVYANYYMRQYMEMVARQNGGLREGQNNSRQAEAAHNLDPQRARDAGLADRRFIRDLVDLFYTTSRFLVLLGIVHIYSSPGRFGIVVFFGMCLYLYQRGFFWLNQNQAVHNNNEAVNINVPVDNNNVIPQGEEGAEQGEEVPAGNPNPEPRAEAPEHPSFMALTWTFLTSFFSSMIPEAQNAL